MKSSEFYNWESNIEVNIMLLKLMGLWPNRKYKLNFYTVYSTVIVTMVTIFHVGFQAINIYFVRRDLTTVIAIIYVGLIECVADLKVYYTIKNLKILKNAISMLKCELFQPRNEAQKKSVASSIKLWKNVYKGLMVCCLACNVFWMLFPFLDATDEKRLPFLAWYPFNFQVSPYYEIAYIFQVLSTIYLTFVHINIDTVISGLNVYIGCQFDLLRDNLKHFADFSDSADNLISCILHHKEILKFTVVCCNFFEQIVFWHLILSGVTIGITMFHLTQVVPFSKQFFAVVSYGSGIVVQIFMYCWFGNDVESKSNLVSYAAFESDWLQLPKNVRKTLLFFVTNLLKPRRIRTLGVFQLSVETFLKILKTAWSYFALLHQISGKN